MAELVSLTGIAHAFGAEPLFAGIDLAVADDERLGLIGANGSGKSTLLRILAGTLEPEEGRRVCRGEPHVVCVDQHVDFPEQATVASALHAAHHETSDLPAAVLKALDEHGFADPDQPVATLSGGRRKRLALVRALLAEPDLLLLDEPTNHLDSAGVDWLEQTLRGARFAAVMVTHDRWFLDRVASRIVELGAQFPGGRFTAAGGYSDFLAAREAFLAGQRSQQERLDNRMRREEVWLARRPKARTTKAVARIKQADQLRDELDAVRQRNAAGRSAAIDFQATGRRGNELVVATDIARAYGEHQVFAGLDCTLAPGECLGLAGANGSGKSTLLHVLAGDLSPDAGSVEHATALRPVVFTQDRSRLDPTATLRRTLCPNGETVQFAGRNVHLIAYARRFLFPPHRLDQPVGSLSGGEQARLLIALLMLEPADLLLLDEPTNDLDIPALEVLETALDEFPGAIVLVTHDRYLLDRLCDRIIGLDGHGGAHHRTSFAEWERTRHTLSAATRAPAAPPTPEARPQPSGGLDWNEQKELRGIEGRIQTAEARLAEHEQRMADPAVYTDPAAVSSLTAAIEAARERVDALYRRWEELESRV
ncbi:MAG: ABC-F family ATP-binding cassette domain-containing protein [Planctomycetota bacterium]